MNVDEFWEDLHSGIGGEYGVGYAEGFWDAFSMITSVDYGKERFFLQDDGRVYDRDKAVYYKHKEEAFGKYLEEIYGKDENG